MELVGDGWCATAGLGAACAVLFLVYVIKRKLDYFKTRGFPSMPFSKTMGFMFKMLSLRMPFTEFLEEVYRHFDGEKIGGYFAFFTPVLVARDPDLVNKILIKDFSYFHDHGIEVDTEVNPLEGHLFNMKGHQWRALRNKLAPTFTSGKLKGMLPQISDCADHLARIILQEKVNEEFLVRDLLSRFSIDVIGSCAFGLEAGALKDPNCEFSRMAKKIFKPGKKQIAKSFFRSIFPKLALRLKMKSIEDDVNDFFFGITRQAFEHRMKTGLKRNDFIDLLLQLKLKGTVEYDPKDLAEEEASPVTQSGAITDAGEAEKLVLTDGLLAAQSFVFLVAGWENIAASLNFILYCLGKHPDAQEKARQEVRRVKEKYNGQISYDALKEMVYLDGCISESLRLYPPGGLLLHTCTKDYTMDDGRIIDKGRIVLVPVYPMQRDPAYFEDPEQYRPERFLPDQNIPSNVFLPFGDGPRICIGRRFVLLELKTLVSKLLDKFRLVNSSKIQEPIRFDPKNFTFDVVGGIWMRFEPLEDQ